MQEDKFIQRLASEEVETGEEVSCNHTSPFFPCLSNTNKTKKTYRIERRIYGYHLTSEKNCFAND